MERSLSGMTRKGVPSPGPSKGQRSVQIRGLLRKGVSVKDIVEYGFPHAEVTNEKVNLQKQQHAVNRVTHERKHETERCKCCGGQAIKGTCERGKCKGCVCRERTNEERGGRWKV